MTPLHAVVAVFMAAIMLRGVLPFNVDVSWWLTICERMLDGQRLYVDILETNPPMAGSVYMLGVIVARAIHMRPEVVTNGLIFLLIAGSLALTWRALRFSSLRERAGGAAAVWAAAMLTILPMYDFGQREHLALVVLLPAVAVYILRANRERVAPSAILIAGLCAATTMNIKPYFVFGVGFCILTAAAQARDWRVLLAPENWIAAALVVIHALCIVAFYPEYFTLIYPLVRDVYLLVKLPLLFMLLTSAAMLWRPAIMVMLALQSRRQKVDTAALVMMAGSLGFAISFFVQAKGWGYHAYPMVALGLLAAGWAVAAGGDGQAGSRRLRASAMLVVALIFASACLWFNVSADTGFMGGGHPDRAAAEDPDAECGERHRSSDGARAWGDMGLASAGALGAGSRSPVAPGRDHRSGDGGPPRGLRGARTRRPDRGFQEAAAGRYCDRQPE